VQLFDVTGRLARDLGQGTWSVGEQQIVFDSSGLAAGFYIVRLRTDSQVMSLPIVVYR
jgi:hypothetical protein